MSVHRDMSAVTLLRVSCSLIQIHVVILVNMYFHLHGFYILKLLSKLCNNTFSLIKIGRYLCIKGCGGTLTTASGAFSSPNYPLPYHPNAECYWTLRTNQGSQLRLSFSDFHLESSTSCTYDYLAVSSIHQLYITPEL